MAARKPAKSTPAKVVPAKSIPVATTTVRNTSIPPKTPAPAPAKKAVTYEAIAVRTFEIWASGKGGSEHQNWLQAETELKGL